MNEGSGLLVIEAPVCGCGEVDSEDLDADRGEAMGKGGGEIRDNLDDVAAPGVGILNDSRASFCAIGVPTFETGLLRGAGSGGGAGGGGNVVGNGEDCLILDKVSIPPLKPPRWPRASSALLALETKSLKKSVSSPDKARERLLGFCPLVRENRPKNRETAEGASSTSKKSCVVLARDAVPVLVPEFCVLSGDKEARMGSKAWLGTEGVFALISTLDRGDADAEVEVWAVGERELSLESFIHAGVEVPATVLRPQSENNPLAAFFTFSVTPLTLSLFSLSTTLQPTGASSWTISWRDVILVSHVMVPLLAIKIAIGLRRDTGRCLLSFKDSASDLCV